MNAEAERELALAEREMGGYGVEEELERIRLKEQAREAKLARKEGLEKQAQAEVDENGNPVEGSLTLDEYIMPTVQNLINALGGWEDIEDAEGDVTTVYRPGDNIIGCLNDIFKLSRLDEEDDERTVARTFARTNLMAELVTVVVELSDRGAFGRKVGSKAARLIARLTWPIDVAAELMEAEDLAGINPDFASLIRSQLEYKALLLRPGVVLEKLMDLLLPNLASQTQRDKEKIRQETEVQALLYIIRNLAMIKDAPSSTHTSADNVEKSSLQSRLIEQLQSSDFLPLLVTLASSSNSREFNQYNVLVLDIVHLLWRGVAPSELCKDQKVAVRDKLSSLLEKEDLSKASSTRNTSSRHSRFGATVAVQAGGGRRVILSKGGAVSGDVGAVMDLSKKRGRIDVNSIKMHDPDAKIVLQPNAAQTLKSFTEEFIRTAFNTFIASILNDIRREQPKIRDKDNLRLAQVCSFVTEFFTLARQAATDKLALRAKVGEDVGQAKEELQRLWNYGYLAEFCDMATIIHLNKRLHLVMDDSPPGWVEIQATCHCFTRLLLLLDSMGASGEEGPLEAAQVLQHKIYYNAELLERPIKLLIAYRNQSLTYLDTIIHFSYVLLRMLERHSKENAHSMVIRKLKRGGKKKKKRLDLDSDEDDEEDYIEANVSRYQDHLFKFGEFEEKWRDERVVHTCLSFLEHWEEFDSPDQMKRCVNILHRIAVKLKTEGMFFRVSILNLFKEILDKQATLPKAPASKELIHLIKYLLRQFFKEAEKSAFIVVEALFPKNRNQWQAHSTWVKEADDDSDVTDQGTSRVDKAPRPPRQPRAPKEPRAPREPRARKGRKAPKRREAGSDSDDSGSDGERAPRQVRERKIQQAKELAHYKSAAWIDDSDDETGDTEFFAKEAAMIALKEAQANRPSMASQGRKKRKAAKTGKDGKGKRRKSAGASALGSGSEHDSGSDVSHDAGDGAAGLTTDDDGQSSRAGSSVRAPSQRLASASPSQAGQTNDDYDMEPGSSPATKRSRPKPKPRFEAEPMPLPVSDDDDEPASDGGDELVMSSTTAADARKPKRRVVIDSEDDDDE